jgi:hypothetical protein
MIRLVRQHTLQTVLKMISSSGKGRRPFLQIIIDLTTLEKRGKFKNFSDLIKVYNGKRGLHKRGSLFSHRKMAHSLEF